MHINEANLNNLIGLWKKYGSRPINGNSEPLWCANTHWPHRCWKKEGLVNSMLSDSTDTTWLKDVPESVILPIWPIMTDSEYGYVSLFEPPFIEKLLLEKKWTCVFEQLAMYMELNEKTTCSPLTRIGFQLIDVRTSEDIKKWVDIGSEAFSYLINRSVIENLINDKDIRLLIGYQGEQPVASALLYKTGDIIGLHQVGVKQAFQGQGVARYFMQEIIAACTLWQGKYIVLQASQAGQPLYENLKFRAQFTIKNFQRVKL